MLSRGKVLGTMKSMSRIPKLTDEVLFLKPERIRSLLWLALALFLFGLFLKVSWELQEDASLDSLDQQILITIAQFRQTSFNGPAVDFTALGSATVLTLFSLIGVVVLLLNRDRRGSAYLAVGSTGAGLGSNVMKHIFVRERPSVVPRLIEVTGFSYPSGHSLGATSFYLLVMFLAWRYFRSWQARSAIFLCAVFVIIGVSFSRLYLGVHYPSDVLSGMLLGSAWACLLTFCFFGQNRFNI